MIRNLAASWQFMGEIQGRRCPSPFSNRIERSVDWQPHSAWLARDIAEVVAAMTEGEQGVESEKASHNILG